MYFSFTAFPIDEDISNVHLYYNKVINYPLNN